MKIHELFNIVQDNGLESVFRPIVEAWNYFKDEDFIPRDVDGNVFNFIPLYEAMEVDMDAETEINILNYIDDPRPLAGIDSSVIPIGESKRGFLLGVKGCIVIDRGGDFEVYKVGPLPIYISLELVGFYNKVFNIPINVLHRATMDVGYSKRVAIIMFESLLVRSILSRYNNLVLLIDGSLINYYKVFVEDYMAVFSAVGYEDNNISVVGLSKKSKIFKKYPELFAIMLSRAEPIYLRVPHYLARLGRACEYIDTFIVKFSSIGFPFRVDIVREGRYHTILNEIFSSSINEYGYPEVLKEAHILSKLSRFEMLALRRFIEVLGGNFHDSFRLRDIIFGAFNSSHGDGR